VSVEEKAITLGRPSYVWRFGQDRRLDLIRRYVPLAGKRTLDVGCGLGVYVEKFAAVGADAFGAEYDEEKAIQAVTRGNRVAVAAGEALPFPAATFDVILLHEVIEHVADDRQTLQEAYRCLRPGGRLVVFAPNRLYPLETHGFYLGRHYHFRLAPLIPWLPDRLRRRFCPHVDTYRAGQLRRLFAGMAGHFVVFTQIYPGYDNIVARRPSLGHWLRRITYFLEKTPLRVFGLSHLVIFEKEHEGHKGHADVPSAYPQCVPSAHPQ